MVVEDIESVKVVEDIKVVEVMEADKEAQGVDDVEVVVDVKEVEDAENLNASESINITCQIINAVSNPTVKWMRHGQPSQFIQIIDNVIAFNNISFNEFSTYECVVENSNGNDALVKVIVEQMTIKSNNHSNAEEVTLPQNSNLKLECTVKGFEISNVTWKKTENGLENVIESNPTVLYSNGSYHILRESIEINNVEPSAEGIYTCYSNYSNNEKYIKKPIVVSLETKRKYSYVIIFVAFLVNLIMRYFNIINVVPH